MASTFHHRRLDSSTSSIRLLSVLPGGLESNNVRCRLHHTTLDACPAYWALSYTWGGPCDYQYVYINGKKYQVSRNLWSFLKQAQETLPSALLWIDAICIDQNSREERNHQVQLMGRIYSNAAKTIVWLGSEGVSISYLFWQLQDADATLSHLDRSDTDEYLRTVYMLINFPYWSRMWIVQELLLAKSIELMYNDDLLDWDKFWAGVQCLVHRARTLRSSSDWDQIKSSYAFRHWEQRNARQSVANSERFLDLNCLLARYSSAQCALIRDRVVGLLPLVEEGSLFKDSYDGTTANLALRVLLHFCGNFETLGRLKQSLRVSHIALREELGMWQPSRLGSAYSSPELYLGEVLNFDVGHGYVQDKGTMRCLTCNAVIGRHMSLALLTGVQLFCLEAMGSSRHMFCVSDSSSQTHNKCFAIFFDHEQSRGTSGFECSTLKPKFESLLGMRRQSSKTTRLYMAIDLFIWVVEHLRLPETTPVFRKITTKVLPRMTKAGCMRLLGPDGYSSFHHLKTSPPGMDVDLVLTEADLLVPVEDGYTLKQWFEYRPRRASYREYQRFLDQNAAAKAQSTSTAALSSPTTISSVC